MRGGAGSEAAGGADCAVDGAADAGAAGGADGGAGGGAAEHPPPPPDPRTSDHGGAGGRRMWRTMRRIKELELAKRIKNYRTLEILRQCGRRFCYLMGSGSSVYCGSAREV